MAEPVRIGVIGTSAYTESMHLTNIKSHPGARISAICGRNTARAQALAQAFGIPAVYGEYREMIGSGSLDALVVSSPDDLHYAMTMDALEAGLHVVCEKPMSMTGKQARAMYARAEAAGVKHMIYFTWRWLPIARTVRRLIDDGYIGRCFQCNLRYTVGFARTQRYLWRLDPARANGILGDIGSHVLDLAQWYIGPISAVSAELATYVDHPGPDGEPMEPANDSAVLALTFANGAQGVVQLTALAHIGERNQDLHLVMHGDAGTLEVDLAFNGGEIRGVRAGEGRFTTLAVPEDIARGVDPRDPLRVFVRQSVGDRLFIDAILQDRPAEPSFYDGMLVQEVIEAALQAQQARCWIPVERG
jgi:predicted dehydrogenase